MNKDELREKIQRRRAETYLWVKNYRPELYEKAVRIGHMAMIDFGGSDEIKRAAEVEAAVMDLIQQIETV